TAGDEDGPLGLVLTGGYRPAESGLDALRAADLFATLVREDTYKVASELHDLLVKTHQSDAGKIAEIKALLWEYLFIDRVLEVAEEARFDWRSRARHETALRMIGRADGSSVSPPSGGGPMFGGQS